MKYLSQEKVAELIGEGMKIYVLGYEPVYCEESFRENILEEESFSIEELVESLKEYSVFVAKNLEEIIPKLTYHEDLSCADSVSFSNFRVGKEVTIIHGDPISFKATPIGEMNFKGVYGNEKAMICAMPGGGFFIGTCNCEINKTHLFEILED
ncbi:hypothetical protein HOD29_02680 [archaeon]|jgi:hypothetical protein|nr:hypothetical protein [archaeon]